MKAFYLGGSLALISAVFGCTPLQSRITGVFSPVAGKWAPGEFSDIRVDGQSLYPELRPYRRVETEQMVKIRVSQLAQGHEGGGNYHYNVLLGPVPGTVQTAEGWLKNTKPVFFLHSGALFMWGINPQAQTKWVSAASAGSTLVIQTLTDQLIERVFFLTGTSITVTPMQGTGAPKTWTTTNTYIEYGPDLNFGEVRNINSNPAVCEFIQDLTEIARDAGWNEAPPTVCTSTITVPDP